MKIKILLFIIISFFPCVKLQSAPLIGRLGIGYSGQLQNDIEAVSFKVQRTPSYAVGAMVGFNSSEDNTLYGLGLKYFRILYDEPQLNFYSALGMAFFNYPVDSDETKNGHQFDGTFGTEFHFTGLESLGLSFEFGFSMRQNQDGNQFGTMFYDLLSCNILFYL